MLQLTAANKKKSSKQQYNAAGHIYIKQLVGLLNINNAARSWWCVLGWLKWAHHPEH